MAYWIMKSKVGDSWRSKSDVGQVNQIPCKGLAHSICLLVQAM